MVLDLPPDLAEVARRELNETPETRTASIQELRQRLEALPADQQPDRLDDEFLVAYLRCTKYRMDVAEKKIRALAEFRRKYPQYTTNLRAEEFREMYDQGFMRILNGRDKQGRVISTLLPSRMRHLKDGDLFMRWNFWVMDKVMANPYLQVNGQVIIEDLAGFSVLSSIFMQKIPQRTLQLCFKMQQDCMPFRLRGIFIVNEPVYMDFMWAIVRPFMSKKMLGRVHFIGKDVRAFHEFIDPAVLPPEFGGTLDEPHSAWLDAQVAAEAVAAAATQAAA